jgi:hypothetical protein
MFRRDITEYPRESLRESIANAVAHRDYSPYVRGSYIQRMFADRLEVRSPGGLFGNVTVDNLENEHSTRNARLQADVHDGGYAGGRKPGQLFITICLFGETVIPFNSTDSCFEFLIPDFFSTLLSHNMVGILFPRLY